MPKLRTVVTVIVVVAIAIAGVVAVGDLRAVADRLGGFSWLAFVAALGLSLANYAIRWLRWEWYLRSQNVRVPAASSIGVFSAGLSLAITPAKVGELIKSYLLRDLHRVEVTATAPIVIAERVTDLVGLVCIATIGVAVYGVAATIVIVAASLVAFGLAVLAWPAAATKIVEIVTAPAFARRLREPLLAIFGKLSLLCKPTPLLIATALAIVAWACECFGFALIVNAFPATEVSIGAAAVIYAVMTIAGALSFLPGGLGVTEAGMTIMLVKAAVSIDNQTALAATLLTRFATLWFGVVIGLAALALVRRKIAAFEATAAMAKTSV